MADKSIFELNLQTTFATNDRLVVGNYANADAEAITGQTLVNLLATALDGHGGITSIAKTSSSGTNPVVDTYTISMADTSTATFTVTNGLKGDTGAQTYVYFRYAHTEPTTWADTTDQPDNWMGVYAGTASTQPTSVSSYAWFEIKGDKGDTGDAASITSQSVDYQVGASGTVAPTGTWSSSVPSVPQGSYLWTRTQIHFNDNTTVESYSVARMGIDGTGAVSTVNSVLPDGGGNVELTQSDINGAVILSTGDATDRAAEIASKLSTYGYCEFGEGDFYLSTPITLTTGQTVKGCGGGTVIRKTSSSTTNGMFIVTSTTKNVTIKDMKFLGANSAMPSADSSTGEFAISISDHAGAITVDNCVFEGLVKAGIVRSSGYSVTNDSDLSVNNCNFKFCARGIEFDQYGEFAVVSNCSFQQNYYGAFVQGGNNKFSNCGFDANVIGFKLYDTISGTNDGHGSAVGCSFNHNTTDSINAENCKIGYVFVGCNVWYGDIRITNSRGIVFSCCLMLGHKDASDNTDIIVSSCNGTIKFVDCTSLWTPTFTITSSPYFIQSGWRLVEGDEFSPTKRVLTTHYTTQSYVTEANFNRIIFYSYNGIIVCRCNLNVSSSPGETFRKIGSVDLPYQLIDDHSVVLPSQSNSGNLLFTIYQNGNIEIYANSSGTGTGWYRGIFVLP